jgi:hypothetical protein
LLNVRNPFASSVLAKPLEMRERIMKKMPSDKDELLPEYRFDYSKAKPNRFAGGSSRTVVVLDEDLSKVFKTPESVNKALRALLKVISSDSTAA